MQDNATDPKNIQKSEDPAEPLQFSDSRQEETDNKSNPSTHLNWSPHYSDGDYGNQMACPRLQTAYNNWSDSDDD